MTDPDQDVQTYLEMDKGQAMKVVKSFHVVDMPG